MKSLSLEQMEKVQGGVSKEGATAFICGTAVGLSATAALLPLGIAIGLACGFSIWAIS